LVGCCEGGNELFNAVECGKNREQLRNCQLLKKDFARPGYCSSLVSCACVILTDTTMIPMYINHIFFVIEACVLSEVRTEPCI
jgi:hypothetical protein